MKKKNEELFQVTIKINNFLGNGKTKVIKFKQLPLSRIGSMNGPFTK